MLSIKKIDESLSMVCRKIGEWDEESGDYERKFGRASEVERGNLTRMCLSLLMQPLTMAEIINGGVILQENMEKYDTNSETKLRIRYVDHLEDCGVLFSVPLKRKGKRGRSKTVYEAEPEILYAFIRVCVLNEESFEHAKKELDELRRDKKWKERVKKYLMKPGVDFMDALFALVFSSGASQSMLGKMVGFVTLSTFQDRMNVCFDGEYSDIRSQLQGCSYLDVIGLKFFLDFWLMPTSQDNDELKEAAKKSIIDDVYHECIPAVIEASEVRYLYDLSSDKEERIQGRVNPIIKKMRDVFTYIDKIPNHRVKTYFGASIDEWLPLIYPELCKHLHIIQWKESEKYHKLRGREGEKSFGKDVMNSIELERKRFENSPEVSIARRLGARKEKIKQHIEKSYQENIESIPSLFRRNQEKINEWKHELGIYNEVLKAMHSLVTEKFKVDVPLYSIDYGIECDPQKNGVKGGFTFKTSLKKN